MSNARIQKLLAELDKELGASETHDDNTNRLVNELKDAFARHQGGDLLEDDESLLEMATQLETKFAVNHPTAEGILREMVVMLGNLGI